ncbi:collagen alpha-3(VI) chain-like [Rhinoraja longicauda]
MDKKSQEHLQHAHLFLVLGQQYLQWQPRGCSDGQFSYDYSSKENAIADALLRLPHEESDVGTEGAIHITEAVDYDFPVTAAEIAAETQKDTVLKQVYEQTLCVIQKNIDSNPAVISFLALNSLGIPLGCPITSRWTPLGIWSNALFCRVFSNTSCDASCGLITRTDWTNITLAHSQVQLRGSTFLGPPPHIQNLSAMAISALKIASHLGITTVTLIKKDIAFLIDESINVGNAYFPLLREFIIKIIQTFSIGRDGMQVAVVLYSDVARTVFYLNSYSTLSEIVSHLNGLRPKEGRTLNTGAALDYVHKNIFTKATGSRIEENVPQMVFIVTAGRSADDVQPPAEALEREGIATIAVGVGNADVEEVKRIAYHDRRAFQVSDFQSLDTIWNTVISSLIYGGAAVTPSALKRDVVFLIDGSAAMGQSFLQVREFLTHVAQQLDIGPDKDKMAVVRYSSDQSIEFGLDTYLTKGEVLEAIRRLVPKAGRLLNTGAALDFTARDVFSPSAGSRRDIGASQILVLITAGKSRDDVGRAASRVKQAGIMPIAIGAKNADAAELQQIVHDSTFALTMRDFQDLSAIQRDLLDKMATKIIIEQADDVKRDIVFIIDGSDNVTPVFSAIQRFISRVVSSLDIGSDKVRVGLVQYSEDPRVERLRYEWSGNPQRFFNIWSPALQHIEDK